MYKINDLTEERFGRLFVIEQCGRSKDRHIRWKCACDCGNIAIVSSRDLVSGHTKSCGCLLKDAHTKHGGRSVLKTDRLYFVWRSIRDRCNNKKCKSYKYYGGRGIRVCIEWDKYENFRKWAMENGYDPKAERYKCTIDRVDNDGGYEPGNCRWVDMAVQNSNKKRSKNAS